MSAPRPPSRRGWCPGVRRPMETGDGLLMRVHPPGGILTAAQARLVADAARAHGNGHLDVTARGNLQIRGVTEETYPALLGRLDQAGLAESERDGPSRLTLLSPLAGLDPEERFDARALAARIEEAVADLQGLPAKLFVAVDGGGLFPLFESGADILVSPGPEDGSVMVSLGSKRGPSFWGTTTREAAPASVRTLLRGFMSVRAAHHSPPNRIRGLTLEEICDILPSSRLTFRDRLIERPPGPGAGLIPLAGNSCAVLLACPFGRCEAEWLARAADWSERLGTGEIRPSPTRGLLLPAPAASAPALLEEAAGAGFIVDPADPRLAVAACPGGPSCASGHVPAPADAAALAEAARRLIAAGMSLHVSGCPKGCAHPGAADLTLVGAAEGCYGVVVGGAARDPASRRLTLTEIMSRLSAVTAPSDLARAFQDSPS